MTGTYREHLLPLVERWRTQRSRVAIFGIGPHTADLLAFVPELEALPVVAYLESRTADVTAYRGRPVVPLDDVGAIADVVLCSSYAHEIAQLVALDPYPVKAYLSHAPQVTADGVVTTSPNTHACANQADVLQVPTFGYPIIVPSSDTPIEALRQAFDRELAFFRTQVDVLAPFFGELDDLSPDAIDGVTPYWNNGYFSGSDARVAYAMVRAHRPRRIFEIGSGNSTKFLRHAIARNGGGTRLVSIDPAPRADVDGLCDQMIREPLQRVAAATFDALEPGDILFMDGTHQVFTGSDSVAFYLHVLPRLAAGVHVHIHDITLPFEYPEEFRDRYYAEQYVLAALLLGGDTWRVRLPVTYLHHRGVLPQGGVSFWMTRTPAL